MGTGLSCIGADVYNMWDPWNDQECSFYIIEDDSDQFGELHFLDYENMNFDLIYWNCAIYCN